MNATATPSPLDPTERVCAGVALLFALAAAVSLAALVSGCIYKGAKITEGTDLAIGMTVPGTEGMVQLNALNYLSGFRLGVAENAALTVEYSTVASNSYFGVVRTETAKRIKAKVEPLADPPAEDADGAATATAPSTEHQAPSTSSAADLSCAAGASSPSSEASE